MGVCIRRVSIEQGSSVHCTYLPFSWQTKLAKLGKCFWDTAKSSCKNVSWLTSVLVAKKSLQKYWHHRLYFRNVDLYMLFASCFLQRRFLFVLSKTFHLIFIHYKGLKSQLNCFLSFSIANLPIIANYFYFQDFHKALTFVRISISNYNDLKIDVGGTVHL